MRNGNKYRWLYNCRPKEYLQVFDTEGDVRDEMMIEEAGPMAGPAYSPPPGRGEVQGWRERQWIVLTISTLVDDKDDIRSVPNFT